MNQTPLIKNNYHHCHHHHYHLHHFDYHRDQYSINQVSIIVVVSRGQKTVGCSTDYKCNECDDIFLSKLDLSDHKKECVPTNSGTSLIVFTRVHVRMCALGMAFLTSTQMSVG